MGVLQFFEKTFPRPEKELPWFYQHYGVHFMPIEESYIDERLDEHRALCDDKYRLATDGFKGITSDDGCFLARSVLDKGDAWKAARITVDFKRALAEKETVWWGRGGMLDHSNPHMRHFWHQLKRRWLSKMGIFNHWFDLGEPEMFYEYAYYYGFPELFREWTTNDGETKKNIVQKHGDIHNLYSLFWTKGADEGYANPENQNFLKDTLKAYYGNDYDDGPRHWTMSRAGTVGSQRYGAMWTGDTRGNFENFRGHLQTQLHMSLLGFDYYSGDAGGFFHNKDGKDPKDKLDAVLYKQWFATASLLDLPLRPHGWALEEGISYGAHVRGDLGSNRANVYRRYELIPYLYSLAHLAHRYAEPIFPPLVYHFQTDPSVREDGTEKMIGPSLLFRIFADWQGYDKPETASTPVYLPKGTWVDYENLEYFDSTGGLTKKIDLFRRERVSASEARDTFYFMNPLFARAGAIIPRAFVDKDTMNALGKRWEQAPRNELMVRVFTSTEPTDFTLYEDDGVSRGYLRDKVRETKISQKATETSAVVTIEKAKGDYIGAPTSRPNVVEFVVRDRKAKTVLVDTRAVTSCSENEAKAFDSSTKSCWYQPRANLIRVKTGSLSTQTTKTVEVQF